MLLVMPFEWMMYDRDQSQLSHNPLSGLLYPPYATDNNNNNKNKNNNNSLFSQKIHLTCTSLTQ